MGSKSFLSKAGTVSPVNFNGIYPIPFYNTAVLMEYYWLQGLPGNVAVVLGRFNPANFSDLNRFANNPREQFLNTSLGNNPLFGTVLTFSVYGALLSWQATENLLIGGGVWDPTTTPPDYGARNGLFNKVSVAANVEYKWKLGSLPGAFRPIFIWTSREPDAVDNPFLVSGIITGDVPQKSDNWMIHLNFEQYIWKPDIPANAPAQVRTKSFDYQEPGLGIFFRFGYVPEDRNFWNIFVSGGIGGRGVVPGRPYDRFGLGVFALLKSSDLDEQLESDPLQDEIGFEVFYNFAVTPWLQVTADLQYVRSAETSVGDTVIPGFRVMTQF